MDDNTRTVLLVVVPLQVFANFALVFVDEESPAMRDWLTWRVRPDRGPRGRHLQRDLCARLIGHRLPLSCRTPALSTANPLRRLYRTFSI